MFVGILFASELLCNNLLASENYKREKFGRWLDLDNNCLNTRHELLKKRSTLPVRLRKDGCLVLSGHWVDPYTQMEYFEASELDIDHLVPLKFSWLYGANRWSVSTLRLFYNDPMNLSIVGKDINRSKGAMGPLEWLPPNSDIHCVYITNFIDVLKNYELSVPIKKKNGYEKLKNKVC